MAYVSPIREVGSGRSLSLAEYIRADLPTTGAHCPFCDSGLVLTDEEAAAERGFSGPMGTNREGYTEEEERDWTWFTTEHDRTFDQGLYSTNDAKYYVKRAVVRALKLRDRAYLPTTRVRSACLNPDCIEGKVNVGCSVDGPLITTDCPQCRSARKDWQSNKQNIPTAAAPTVDPVVIRAAVEEIWDAAEARPLGTLSIDETVAILNKHLSGEAGKQSGE
jgi:hypothetical protein